MKAIVREPELLNEDWVSFRRIYCKEGYIDQWTGDCIDNPNKPTKNSWNLNSMVNYYRLNDNRWEVQHNFDRSFIVHLSTLREEFSAEEIYNTYKK